MSLAKSETFLRWAVPPDVALRDTAMRAVRVRANGEVDPQDECLGECELHVNAQYCRFHAWCADSRSCSEDHVNMLSDMTRGMSDFRPEDIVEIWGL